MSDAKRVKIEPPTGELLPAEERLANVLKAIEDRIREEQDNLKPLGNPEIEVRKRYFIAGLDIAWSLTKTESLRRQPETQN
jgi:hypothetical protein